MPVSTEDFGEIKDGQKITRYCLTNKNGIEVKVLSYGAIISEIHVPDRNGKLTDVVTGYSDIKGWEEDGFYFGTVIGRVANRINKGKFKLDGHEYQLPINNGPHHLHGGVGGFHKRVWDGKVDKDSVTFTYVSADGEEGYPGQLTATVVYQLGDEGNELMVQFHATTTKPTLVNLTNHAYFNLQGHKSKDIYDHKITIYTSKFTPKVDDVIPTGEIAKVTGTAFDLQSPTQIGPRIHELPVQGVKEGFDNNYCIDNAGLKPLAARVEDESSGRVLEVFTTQPGVHFYTSNYVNNVHGKEGAVYGKHCAFCLETQNYPDAINHSAFPSCVLRPSEEYRHTTWFKFTTMS